MTRHPRSAVLAALLASLAACSVFPDDPSAANDPAVVEVFSNHRGGDADAFRDVLATFTDQTGIPTRLVGTAALGARLPERVRDGDPPDVALIPQPALLAELARDGRDPGDELGQRGCHGSERHGHERAGQPRGLDERQARAADHPT